MPRSRVVGFAALREASSDEDEAAGGGRRKSLLAPARFAGKTAQHSSALRTGIEASSHDLLSALPRVEKDDEEEKGAARSVGAPRAPPTDSAAGGVDSFLFSALTEITATSATAAEARAGAKWDFSALVAEADDAHASAETERAERLERELEAIAARDEEFAAIMEVRRKLGKRRGSLAPSADAADATAAAAGASRRAERGPPRLLPLARAQDALDRLRGRKDRQSVKLDRKTERQKRRNAARHMY
jgi:hypothetical protein